MYCVLSSRVAYLFYFYCYGVDVMDIILKRINHDERKYDTSLNICIVPTPLEEAWNLAAVSIVASDNYGSEYNNEVLKETDNSNYGSVKPSSPSRI